MHDHWTIGEAKSSGQQSGSTRYTATFQGRNTYRISTKASACANLRASLALRNCTWNRLPPLLSLMVRPRRTSHMTRSLGATGNRLSLGAKLIFKSLSMFTLRVKTTCFNYDHSIPLATSRGTPMLRSDTSERKRGRPRTEKSMSI